MERKIRLTDYEVEQIILNFKSLFLEKDKLYLFGSRADLNKKGGDIDLYIETNENNYEKALDLKIKYISKLWDAIGEQKIDIVLNILSSKQELAIYSVAKKEGVRLV